MTTRASEEKLGALHEQVATVLSNALTRAEIAANAVLVQVEDEDEGVKDISIGEVSPALLAVATKFLKDNEITAQVGSDSTIEEVRNKLKERKKKVGNILAFE